MGPSGILRHIEFLWSGICQASQNDSGLSLQCLWLPRDLSWQLLIETRSPLTWECLRWGEELQWAWGGYRPQGICSHTHQQSTITHSTLWFKALQILKSGKLQTREDSSWPPRCSLPLWWAIGRAGERSSLGIWRCSHNVMFNSLNSRTLCCCALLIF